MRNIENPEFLKNVEKKRKILGVNSKGNWKIIINHFFLRIKLESFKEWKFIIIINIRNRITNQEI